MGLRHVYVHDILNTTMVVVLQVLFHYEIIYEINPPRLGKQVKESQSEYQSYNPVLFCSFVIPNERSIHVYELYEKCFASPRRSYR